MGSDTVGSADLAEALGRARRVDEIATIALRWLTELRGVVRAGFALPVVGGRQLRFLSSDGATVEGTAMWCSIDAYDRLPLNDAIRTGRNVVLDSPDDFAREYPELFAAQADDAPRRVVALALRAGEQRLGGLLLYRDRELADPTAELAILDGLAADVAGALLAARSPAGGPVELVCEQAAEGGTPGEPLEAAHLVLPADETAPGLARRFLRGTLRDWNIEDEVVDAAMLCASEVVTNVILHVQESSVISTQRREKRLTVHVHQPTFGEPPDIKPVEHDDLLAVAGRGLALVAAVSDRWDTSSTGSMSCVWFELGLSDAG
ncbi:MAG TPA: ATP-binding protein [Nocardioidaceae bacterium]|nr:ATP-binding protein [Nocardioidaceae bacterium]